MSWLVPNHLSLVSCAGRLLHAHQYCPRLQFYAFPFSCFDFASLSYILFFLVYALIPPSLLLISPFLYHDLWLHVIKPAIIVCFISPFTVTFLKIVPSCFCSLKSVGSVVTDVTYLIYTFSTVARFSAIYISLILDSFVFYGISWIKRLPFLFRAIIYISVFL